MLTILMPMCHANPEQESFPRVLHEIDGKPMIQVVIESLTRTIKRPYSLVFVVNKLDCDRYHLDDVLRLISNGNCEIIRAINPTKGAACSCLMAIDKVQKDQPLIIVNSNQVIATDIEAAIKYFEENGFDAGTITIESVHPKWSFVRTEGELVVEAAEKRPISKDAIAGFYYYKHATDYFTSVMSMVKKDVNYQGSYYNAPAFNEMILQSKLIKALKISNSQYFNFSDENQILNFRKSAFYESQPNP